MSIIASLSAAMASAKPPLNAHGCGGARLSGSMASARPGGQRSSRSVLCSIVRCGNNEATNRAGGLDTWIARVARVDLRLLEPVRHGRRHRARSEPPRDGHLRSGRQYCSVAGIVAARQHDRADAYGLCLARRRSPGSIQDCRCARQRRPRDRHPVKPGFVPRAS